MLCSALIITYLERLNSSVSVSPFSSLFLKLLLDLRGPLIKFLTRRSPIIIKINQTIAIQIIGQTILYPYIKCIYPPSFPYIIIIMKIIKESVQKKLYYKLVIESAHKMQIQWEE